MKVYNSVVKGLEEAIAYEKGELKKVKVNKIQIADLPRLGGSQIKMIRTNYNLTQSAFSSVLGVSKKTVEAWESGKNIPRGPAQRMLNLMSQDGKFLEKYAIISSQ